MDKRINAIISKYTDNERNLDSLVVTAFVTRHNLKATGGYIAPFVVDSQNALAKDIEILSLDCTIEDVINIFELAIPMAEKTTIGAVYTPKYIRDYIVGQIILKTDKPLADCLCADISCGCGAFLYTLLEIMHKRSGVCYKSLLHNLYGVDISATSIGRAKILLALAALQNGEIVEDSDFRLYTGDALVFDFMSIPGIAGNKGLDIIVGNPPYVRSKHIDTDTKSHLPLWKTSKVGNADLYIPFFEIGLSILNEKGLLGYITVNSFFKSVNARALRTYLSQNNLSISIIDFGEQLVFRKKLAYTCLVFMSKTHSDNIHYVKADVNAVENGDNFIYNHIPYESLNNHRGWNLNRNEVLENIRLIENAGVSLGDKYIIKNGIATLANDIFIFKPVRTDDNYYYLIKDGKVFQVEKGICRDIVKPNILKTEEDIPQKVEKIISPYDSNCNVITEEHFITAYPRAYEYLTYFRKTLDARDKGEGDYGAWFAFGRTQAIADNGKKLLFPYMSDLPHFVYTPQRDMMIYCGYAIYNESETELLFLKRVLESSVFDYYMKNTSKPYSTGYYSYAKNYVKNFGLYPFSEEQKRHLLAIPTKEEADEFIRDVYSVVI